VKFVINSKESLYEHIQHVSNKFHDEKYLSGVVKTATRIDIQNRWIQQFYNMVSSQSGQPRQQLINHCKYYHGLPILFAELPDESKVWRKMMVTLTEEERLLSMQKTAVTSLLDVKECGDYITQLISHFDNWELPRKDWDK